MLLTSIGFVNEFCFVIVIRLTYNHGLFEATTILHDEVHASV